MKKGQKCCQWELPQNLFSLIHAQYSHFKPFHCVHATITVSTLF